MISFNVGNRHACSLQVPTSSAIFHGQKLASGWAEKKAQELYQILAGHAPHGLLQLSARYRLAELAFNRGDYSQALNIFNLTGEKVGMLSRILPASPYGAAIDWNCAAMAPGFYLCLINLTDDSGKTFLCKRLKLVVVR